MQNQIIDVSSVFTADQLFIQEKARLEALAIQSKSAIDTPITDKKSYQVNHDMQMKIQDERVTIEKARKNFTANLDEKKKFAIERERELTNPLIAIEDSIKAKKEEYNKEQERIKAEEEAQKMRSFQARYDEMVKYGATTDLAALRDMTDDGFRMMADMYKKKWEEREAIRIAEEADKKRIDDEAEAKRQAELEDMRKWKEEQAKIEENNRIQAQENARKAQAIKDKEDQIKYQEELKKVQEKAREDERKRIEYDRIAKEQEQIAEHQRMVKEKDYNEWLELNGVTPEKKDNFKIEKIGNEVILWEKVSVYHI